MAQSSWKKENCTMVWVIDDTMRQEAVLEGALVQCQFQWHARFPHKSADSVNDFVHCGSTVGEARPWSRRR